MILDLSAAVLAEVSKYAKPATGQKSLTWTEEDEHKHPRDESGRFAHTMSRGEFHQQEKMKPGYDLQQTNKTYWASVKAAALEGKEVHPKADEEHRQIFGEVVPRGLAKPERTTVVGGDEARFTGKTQAIGGGTFHEVEMLEGDRKGQTQLVRDEAEKAAESEKKQAEWKEQQEGFRRLHESAGQPGSQSGKKPAVTPTESAVTKMRESIKKALVEDFGEKIGGARKDKARPLGSRGKKADDANDARPAWARRYNVSQIEKSSNKAEEGKWSITDEKDTSAWGIPRQKGVFNSKAEAEAALPLIAVSRNHRVNVISGNMKDDNREFGIVRNISERKRAVVKGGFKSEDEAMRYMASHANEIIEHQFPRYEDYAYLDHVERKGPEHKTAGSNVTPDDFQKAFQFRGGEFWNWQSGKDGVTSLNHAYDALHDLSDALGLPAKSVALNGDLAIAFGARGTGGKNSARAHYEPDARVMNLTKMRGAGSLAHEWSHALDWHLGSGEHAISDPTYKTKLRPEVAAAAKTLRDAISTKETTRVREESRETKQRDTAREALERHFKELETDLKGSSYRPAKPFTPEQQKQWDAAKAKILSGDVGESKYILKDPDASAKSRGGMTGKHSFPVLEELNTLYKRATGRSFHTSDTNSTGNRIYWAIKRFDDGNKRVASVGEGAADKIRGKSDFHNEAVKLDSTQIGNYYSLPHEMFARAFEAYAADKLEEKGIRSDYLVSRGKTDNRAYAMFGMKPFPEGDERKAINAAFDNFFAALKHQPRSDERGEHVQLYARERAAGSKQVAAYAAQRGLFDESEHPRDEAGKFALRDRIHDHLSKAIGPVKHRDILRAMGHTDVDPQNPQANPVNKALKEMRDAGEIEAHQPQWGEPSFSAKQSPPKLGETSPTKPQSVAGQQQGLFDRGEFTTGQKSLFNVITPDKPKKKTTATHPQTAEILAAVDAKLREHLKSKETLSPADRGIVLQQDSLPGQRSMFSMARIVADNAARYAFDASKHPRGQPKNAGQFTAKGTASVTSSVNTSAAKPADSADHSTLKLHVNDAFRQWIGKARTKPGEREARHEEREQFQRLVDETLNADLSQPVERLLESEMSPVQAGERPGLLKVDQIHVDPSRFQYKLNTDDSGVTKQFDDVEKFNPMLSGTIHVWTDPDDGKTYVVNGHHRYELAQRTGFQGDLQVYHLNAKDSQEARALGALINIAGGNGTSVDAAKFMRDTGSTATDLQKYGISPSGQVAKEGTILSKLSPRLFDKVTQGLFDKNRAVAIASHVENPNDQDKLAQHIDKYEERTGREASDGAVAQMAKKMALSGRRQHTEKNLFGEEEFDDPTFVERAELESAIRRDIAARASKFAAVSTTKAANVLEGRNKIDADANKSEADRLRQLLDDFDRETSYSGPVSDAFNEAARRLADAPRQRNELVKELGRTIPGLLASQTDRRAETSAVQSGGASGGSGSDDEVEEPRPVTPLPGQKGMFSRQRYREMLDAVNHEVAQYARPESTSFDSSPLADALLRTCRRALSQCG